MSSESGSITTDAPHSWNYRVHGYTYYPNVPGADPEEVYQIIEAYYNLDDKVVAWGKISPHGESLDELRDDLRLMIEATEKAVLDDDDLPERDWNGNW